MSMGCSLAVVSRRKVPRGTDHAETGWTRLLPVCLALTSSVQLPEWLQGHHRVTSSLACEARPGLDTEGVWGASTTP